MSFDHFLETRHDLLRVMQHCKFAVEGEVGENYDAVVRCIATESLGKGHRRDRRTGTRHSGYCHKTTLDC